MFEPVFLILQRMDTHINRKDCGVSEHTGRVFNGKIIERPQIPWIVQIVSPIQGTKHDAACGGSIITRNVVLTAAHCLTGSPINEVQIYYNSTKTRSGPINYGESLYVHPSFNKKTAIKYDIALVKVREYFKFDRFVRPVCLAKHNIYLGHTPLLSGGWGIIDDRNPPTFAENLLYTMVRAMSASKCKKILKRFRGAGVGGVDDKLMTCLEGYNGTLCGSDSGGPITLRRKGHSMQVGVLSLGSTCNNHTKLLIVIRVAKFVRWIKVALHHPQRWRVLTGGKDGSGDQKCNCCLIIK
nr:trypsin, alkaline A-like [Rhipicephalus microplus]